MTSKSWQLYLQMVGKQTRRWDKESSFIQLGTADLDGQSKRYRPGTETFSEEKLISISARPKFDESVELHDLCLWNFLPARYVFSFAHMRTREDQVHVLWVFSCLLSPVCWIFFFLMLCIEGYWSYFRRVGFHTTPSEVLRAWHLLNAESFSKSVKGPLTHSALDLSSCEASIFGVHSSGHWCLSLDRQVAKLGHAEKSCKSALILGEFSSCFVFMQ